MSKQSKAAAQMKAANCPGEVPGADDQFLPARAVWERYGVTQMTLWRWLQDPEMGFPKPIYIGRFRYFSLNALLDFERAQVAKSAAA